LSLATHLAALEPVLSFGGRIFPIAPRAKTPPLVTDWPRRASCNEDVISRWEKSNPGCNWGVVCGPESKVWVLDVDGERGENSLQSLVEQHGTWEKTLSASTGNGSHFYFKWPDTDAIIPNSASKIAPGLDVRGRRGYVVIPPSLHPSGTPYTWTANLHRAPAPPWLLEAVAGVARPVRDPREFGILPQGRRNDGLFRYAGKLRRDGGEKEYITSKLLEANRRRCKPPLDDQEVVNIANSIMQYEAGGPDPLQQAWNASAGEYAGSFERFVALAEALQQARPNLSIALPLRRIADLFGLPSWSTVSYWRSKAVAQGILKPTEDYIAHRKAGMYQVSGLGSLNSPSYNNPVFVTKPIVTEGIVTTPPSYKEEEPLVTVPRSPLVTVPEHRKDTSFDFGWNVTSTSGVNRV
jgi:hypothetical protein